jgi:hypothetical protein
MLARLALLKLDYLTGLTIYYDVVPYFKRA